MSENRTWTLALTPPDGPATTLTDLSRDEMFALLRDKLYGASFDVAPELERRAA